MINTSVLSYHGDGLRMIGYFAIDDANPSPRPAVLIAPEAPGLDDFNRERCTRLAALGYAAFALDIHGGGEVIANREQMTERLQPCFTVPLRDGRRCYPRGYCRPLSR